MPRDRLRKTLLFQALRVLIVSGFSLISFGIAGAQELPGPNIAVDKSSLPSVVEGGKPFEYKISVSNLGDADATDVTLIDSLPSEVQFDGVTTTQGSCAFDSGTHQLTCQLGSLPPLFSEFSFEVSLIEIAVRVTAPLVDLETVLTNTVRVSASNEAPENGGDNEWSVTTWIIVCRKTPFFEVRKVVGEGDPVPGVPGARFRTFLKARLDPIPPPAAFDLNELGDVAFFGSWSLSAQGIFLQMGDSLYSVARVGEGTPVGGTFSGFGPVMGQIALNNKRDVVFVAKVHGGRASEGVFLYRLSPEGSILSRHVVAQVGGATPEGGVFPTFFFGTRLAVNDERKVAFSAGGSLYLSSLSEDLMSQDGQVIPGEVLSTVVVGGGQAPRINESGAVLFFKEGLSLWEGGQILKVALPGDLITGLRKVFEDEHDQIRQLFGFGYGDVLNDLGEVAFEATWVKGAFGAFSACTGILQSSSRGIIELVVRDSDGTPVGGTFGRACVSDSPFSTPSRNNLGETVWVGTVLGGPFDGDDGIFRLSSAGSEAVVMEGDCTPVGGTFSELRPTRYRLVHWPIVNDRSPAANIAFHAGVASGTNPSGIFMTQEPTKCRARLEGPDPLKVDSRGWTVATQPVSNVRVSFSVTVPIYKQEAALFNAWMTDEQGQKSSAVDVFVNGEKIETGSSADKLFFSFKHVNDIFGDEEEGDEVGRPFPPFFTVDVRSQSDPECKMVKRIPIVDVCSNAETSALMEELFIEKFLEKLASRAGIKRSDLKVKKDIGESVRESWVEVSKKIGVDQAKTLVDEVLKETVGEIGVLIRKTLGLTFKISEKGINEKTAKEIAQWAIAVAKTSESSTNLLDTYDKWQGGRLSPEETTGILDKSLGKILQDVGKDVGKAVLGALFQSGFSPASQEFKKEVDRYRALLGIVGVIPLAKVGAKVGEVVLGIIEFVGGVAIDKTWLDYVVAGQARDLALDARVSKIHYQSLLNLRDDLAQLQPPKDLVLCEEDREFIRRQLEAVIPLFDMAQQDAQRILRSVVSKPVLGYKFKEWRIIYEEEPDVFFDYALFSRGEGDSKGVITLELFPIDYADELTAVDVPNPFTQVRLHLDPDSVLAWPPAVPDAPVGQRYVATIDIADSFFDTRLESRQKLEAFVRDFNHASQPWTAPEFQLSGPTLTGKPLMAPTAAELVEEIKKLLSYFEP